VFIDFVGKANGRGAYLCPDTECLKKAEKRDALSRSLGIKIEKNVYVELEKQLTEQAKKV
jgi:predicted RNA-binding protein YlxR (DUF448 family)